MYHDAACFTSHEDLGQTCQRKSDTIEPEVNGKASWGLRLKVAC
jgi:hypothetical protein